MLGPFRAAWPSWMRPWSRQMHIIAGFETARVRPFAYGWKETPDPVTPGQRLGQLRLCQRSCYRSTATSKRVPMVSSCMRCSTCCTSCERPCPTFQPASLHSICFEVLPKHKGFSQEVQRQTDVMAAQTRPSSGGLPGSIGAQRDP